MNNFKENIIEEGKVFISYATEDHDDALKLY
jgi:hypothetical protein